MDRTTIIQLTGIQQTLRQTAYSTKTLKTTRRSGQEVTDSITLNANRLPCPRILSVITQVQGVTVIILLISKVLNVNVAKEMEFLRISFGSLFQTRLDR